MKRRGIGFVACGLLAIFGSWSVTLSQDKASATKTKPQESKTQEVIAEGVGASADEAIKDAYRNAVRQVVGAVVDADTLVKNDEVIDDKVLTYSDGFIKGYEEVAGSKKFQGGLHRIKIKAQVERRSVIAKLKAANVTVKDVDGKGLFAEAVTQLDAEKDAAALLKKQFEGFPQSCLTATIIGKPELVEKSADQAKVKITVQIEPDLKAYKAFSSRLIPILGKLAKSKGEFTAKFGRPEWEKNSAELMAIGDGGFGNNSLLASWIPIAFERRSETTLKADQITLAVATNRTKAGDRIDFSYFVIDKSLQPILAMLASRAGHGSLRLMDAEGESIATERFPLTGTLVTAYGMKSILYELGLSSNQNRYEFDEDVKRARLFIISPVFFRTNDNVLGHQVALNFPCKMNLSLDELKSVKDAKCEIKFDE